MEQFSVRPFTMTPRQLAFLNKIKQLIKESGGVCPTAIELAKAMNVSEQAATGMINRLVQRGFLEKPKHMHRALRIVGRSPA